MLGYKVKEYRSIKGLTQEQLALKINRSPTLITKIETNRANPSIETLKRIAKALDVSISDLLNQDNKTI